MKEFDSFAMEEMDNLYGKLQVFLMKKDDECGKLRFLASRTTTENSNDVQEICDSVGDILRSCGIPTEEDTSTMNPRCVQAFKYLALNTNFESQENLTEDPLNGHLVDICPPLSPYLLIEILWSLRYEEIIAESILHIPLDLAVELVEISRRCIGLLDFPRGLNFLSLMTLNCYKKLRRIEAIGALTTRLDESLERLMISFQELMALFLDPKFTRITEVSDIQKSERHGLILKRMLSLTRDSLHCSKNGVILSSELSTIYKITYGREPYRKMNENFPTQLGMLDQELVHILLKKLTDIAIKTYIDWASLEDSGNSKLTLQKSLGIDSYDFIEFTKSYENLIQLDQLVGCLQQISSKPDSRDRPWECDDLEELRVGALDGKSECLKALMGRYREWNHEIFAVVRKNRSSLDKDDFLHLLEYLTLVITKDGQEDHKREVYTTVMKVLLQQDIKNVYETILAYILNHDARNTLESLHTEDVFKKFMSRNKNFSSASNLRLVLFFLAKNPRKILSILLKMSIGHAEYENVMITPRDLILLSPVMSIRDKSDETLFLVTLREICLEGAEWSTRKFSDLVRVMLEECVTSADEIVNKVLVPYLREKTGHSANLRSILICLRETVTMCTKEIQFEALIVAIAGKMSRLRNDTGLSKNTMSETLDMMTRIVEFLIPKYKKSLNRERSETLVGNLEKILRPVDKHHYAKLLISDDWQKIDVYDTVRDYERRCILVINRVRACREIIPEEREILDFDPSQFDEHYLRHIFVTSTEKEYMKFATEAVVLNWDNFNCKNEYEAYEMVVRITIEACRYSLEFPDLTSPGTFAGLLKGLARFTRSITSLEIVKDTEKIDKALMENLRILEKSISLTNFSLLYTNFLVKINNRVSHKPVNEALHELAMLLDSFVNKCLDISHNATNFQHQRSSEANFYKITHEFVEEIMSLDCDDENYSSLCKMYRFLRETNAPEFVSNSLA